ncbi:MAG: hypothetical protein AVO34_11370 [Firmicutes bacterium ML8_F2]|jgi:hypothetical protein|nr:MAG: hypothetical protein AVO34_11370 [Firmicutes bacterium ML8_F2]
MIGISKEIFMREYSRKLMEGSAALFVGAGLSQPAGYVNWRELLNEIADDLNLEIDREHDLIALAQYHYNDRNSRTKLNEKLIEEFTKNAKITHNHNLIVKLPIYTIWTTNYDKLIENSLEQEYKQVDVKITPESVSQFRPGTDVTVFKMHGDVSLPDKAVLTKDDYENYSQNRELFTIRLKSDLVSLTFLFLGFSFTDPNIDYILSRIRILLQENKPTHYCIVKKPKPRNSTPEAEADYEYDLRKLELRVNDLKRFGIQTVLIDDYKEITDILVELNRRAFMKNIFVSGSADEGFDGFDHTRLLLFIRSLGYEIISRGYNLVSGYGKGIGSDLVLGALESAYLTPSSIRNRLILRPFPLTVEKERKSEVYLKWREYMLSFAGFSIYVAGNKFDPAKRDIVLADGVMQEFKIGTSESFYNHPIPVGVTGYVAREIWEKVYHDLSKYYGPVNVAQEFSILNEAKSSNEELIKAIFSIIEKVRDKKV